MLFTAAVGCWLAAVAIGLWLFSGESHVPSAGSLGSWLADGLVVVLVALGVRQLRRALRAHQGRARPVG